MATIAAPVSGDQRLVFHDVSWQTYLGLLSARGEGRLRLAYHRGVLEIMTLSQLHERLSRLLHNFVKVISKEYGLGTVGENALEQDLGDLIRAELKNYRMP